MIPRYARPAMTAIWSPETRFRIWFEIEAHALDAMAELGTVPQSAADAVNAWWATNPPIDVARIDAIEAVTRHDVIAFLTWVSENVGEEARYLHQGMTSSDVLDTALAVQLARASDILLDDLDQLLAALERRAREHRLTPTIGRSHGIHAEPDDLRPQARRPPRRVPARRSNGFRRPAPRSPPAPSPAPSAPSRRSIPASKRM
jgi:adenylosuccinate lyase